MGGSQSTSPSESSPVFEKPWRNVDWSEKEKNNMKWTLAEFKPNPKVNHLRILLHGPIGSGKSSFINSVKTVFQNRSVCDAAVDTTGRFSFTLKYTTYQVKKGNEQSFAFVFNDIMGLEEDASKGVQTDDIISALQGHVSEGYKFNPKTKLTKECMGYVQNPSLNDKVHCLVSVLPADRISIMLDGLISKMRKVREEARDLEIPQVIIMTMVDKTCPVVSAELKDIYKSKKIYEKMNECSNRLGVPMNCIFPVQNYSKELNTESNIDTLILTALKHIVNFANDHVDRL